jgi:hypothetical protein
MNWSKLALFSSGLFFGGAVDHFIYAIARREVSPYGVRVGTAGNWAMAGIDLGIAVLLYRVYRYLELRPRGPRLASSSRG